MAEDMLGASRCQAGASADVERLQALICAHMVALETLSKRLDAEALLCTFTPLLELVRESGLVITELKRKHMGTTYLIRCERSANHGRSAAALVAAAN